MIRPTFAAAIATVVSIGFTAPASAYPVDCAILLCLAGGFPPSEPCLRAKAVMMQRIFGFPFQPPVQIWNCPFRANLSEKPSDPVLHEAVLPGGPWQSKVAASPSVLSVADGGVDISGPEFAYLRSLRVMRIEYRQLPGKENTCARRAWVEIGRYDDRATFVWAPGHTADIPSASAFRPAGGCAPYAYRSLLIDWRDVEGGYGFEEMRY